MSQLCFTGWQKPLARSSNSPYQSRTRVDNPAIYASACRIADGNLLVPIEWSYTHIMVRLGKLQHVLRKTRLLSVYGVSVQIAKRRGGVVFSCQSQDCPHHLLFKRKSI